MLDEYQRPPLRYRRFRGGYHRDDVEFAIDELRLTLRQLNTDFTSLRDRNRELESELESTHAELEAFREKEEELTRLITSALRRADEIEEAGSRRAREIIEEAKETANQLRAEAHRRIDESSGQFNEVLRVKDRLLDAMRRVVADFDHAISRVEHRDQPPPQAVEGVLAEAAPQPEPAAVEPAPFVPLQAGSASPEEHAPPQPEPDALFETRVELDAGPFPDFASLSAFERSLGHLPKIEDVYVRRLADERALIELTLSEPVPLLQALRESLPYSFEPRAADRSRLVVDVSPRSEIMDALHQVTEFR